MIFETWHKVAIALGATFTAILAFWKLYKKVLKPLWKAIMAMYYELTNNGGGSLKDITFKMSNDVGIIMSVQSAMIKLSETPMFRCDQLGRCTMINKAWTELSGMQPAEADGWGWLNAIHHSHRERVKSDFINAVTANSEFNSHYRFVDKVTGENFMVECCCIIDRNAKKEVVSIIGTIIKI